MSAGVRCAVAVAALALSACAAGGQGLPGDVALQLPGLLKDYKALHAAPELSHQEAATSAYLAGELRKSGFTVTERVGKYADGSQAYGLVGLMKNGPGKTLLVRADMDALPVEEKTGLPYASRVRGKNAAGQEVGVMHACGHDIHVTTMVGVARMMAARRAQWHGTLLLVGQPSEEVIDGARAMLRDRLYERFGRPDMAVALHDNATLEAGRVGITSGPALASSTSVYVTLRGAGGHGAYPASTKDPVVMAAEFIMALQTIVSRQVLPTQPAVVTVGTIQGGTKNNIIPDEVKLGLTTRSFDDKVREDIVADIRRTAEGVALIGGVAPDRKPIVETDPDFAPSTYNNPALTEQVKSALVAAVGAGSVIDLEPVMGAEDFGVLGLEGHQIPTVMFWLGAVDPAAAAASKASGKPLPSLHSSLFAPLPEPTLRTGVTAMSAVALELLK